MQYFCELKNKKKEEQNTEKERKKERKKDKWICEKVEEQNT